jgi:hypothetical protein
MIGYSSTSNMNQIYSIKKYTIKPIGVTGPNSVSIPVILIVFRIDVFIGLKIVGKFINRVIKEYCHQ